MQIAHTNYCYQTTTSRNPHLAAAAPGPPPVLSHTLSPICCAPCTLQLTSALPHLFILIPLLSLYAVISSFSPFISFFVFSFLFSPPPSIFLFFFFNDPAPPEISPLPLHDPFPI